MIRIDDGARKMLTEPGEALRHVNSRGKSDPMDSLVEPPQGQRLHNRKAQFSCRCREIGRDTRRQHFTRLITIQSGSVHVPLPRIRRRSTASRQNMASSGGSAAGFRRTPEQPLIVGQPFHRIQQGKGQNDTQHESQAHSDLHES